MDDTKRIVNDPKGQDFHSDFVVFDLETTGFSPKKNKIIEIGAVKVQNGSITERFSSFVNPQIPIPFDIEELTGIRDDMVIDAPLIEEILPENRIEITIEKDLSKGFDYRQITWTERAEGGTTR